MAATQIIPRTSVSGIFWSQSRHPLKPSGNSMYHQFNIQKFLRSAHTVYLWFSVDLKTNTDYFTVQH